MASYGIGEVEALTGLPASTLRHWEKVLPLLDPRKDEFGRRLYSEADVRLIFRLKYLTAKRDLSLKAAASALIAEGASPRPDLRARLSEIRGELIGLYFESRASGCILEKTNFGHRGTEVEREGEKGPESGISE